MTLTDALPREISFVKRLFHKAFPPEERPPFFMMTRGLKKRAARLLIAKDNGRPVGFAYLVCREDVAYLFFLAVAETDQGKGYGSGILSLLKKEYEGKRLFLAREDLDPAAGNYEERLRRHAFYRKNGFSDWPVRIKEGSVIYDVMGVGDEVSPDEYDALMTLWCGRLFRHFVDMRLLLPETEN